MKYISTRGEAPILGFEGVLLAGLARDGGLYVPQSWPVLSASDIRDLQQRPYAEIAVEVMRRFMEPGEADADFRALVEESYRAFRHPAVTPLVQIGPADWVLELFHGPTLAFKDVAMQVLGRLMDRALARRGQRATVIVATSGDTGGAALEAFRGRSAIDVFVLFPHGRVSDVQRRQMTTPVEDNVHAIALEGTFDDCQATVKALFNDHALRDRLALAGVNSINWARIIAQVVYYFASATALGAPDRRLSFCVPTGNFGDIFAGYVAGRMGLPIDRLIVATNANDILARTLSHGAYEPRGVVATQSPSMDIQISSNFERLVFEASGRDAGRVRELMGQLAEKGRFELSASELAVMRATFDAAAVSEDETRATIVALHQRAGYLADPHTAVGIAATAKARPTATAVVTLATAHPAKFPDAIKAAVGWPPPEPEVVTRQRNARERVAVLPNHVGAVADFITRRSRVTRTNS